VPYCASPYSRLRYIQKRVVLHSKESSGAFPCLLCSVNLSVDRKKEDERIDNAEQIDHCEANEAAQQHPAVV
jgi:hypothetical protein